MRRLLVVLAITAAVLGTASLAIFPFVVRESGKRGCRAAQFEAHRNLTGIYQAEKAFHERWGTYTTDLGSLDWQPMSGSTRYLIGFRETALGLGTAGLPIGHDAKRRHFPFGDPPKASAGRSLTLDELPESFASRDGFVVSAIADLDEDPDLDVWTMDQARNLVIVRSDCLGTSP